MFEPNNNGHNDHLKHVHNIACEDVHIENNIIASRDNKQNLAVSGVLHKHVACNI